MLRSLYRPPDGPLRTELSPEDLALVRQERGGLLWLDLSGEPAVTAEPLLRAVFGFHPLAVEDALKDANLPKVDDWGEYLYAVLHGVAFDLTTGEVRPAELDVFLGTSFLVTCHEAPLTAVDQTWTTCQRDERLLAGRADRLLHALLDELAESYYPVADALSEALDSLQDQVLDRPTTATLHRILQLKHAVLRLHRLTSPQREVLARLARDEYAPISQESKVYFRDVYDQFVQLHDLNESLRDQVLGSLDTYLSVINNRMNEVMQRLTIVATFFMPASFIVGFFGMNSPREVLGNWLVLPPDAARTAAAATMLVLLGSFVGTWWVMRRRGWL